MQRAAVQPLALTTMMTRMSLGLLLFLLVPSRTLVGWAADDRQPQPPVMNTVLDRALGDEGGVQIYMDQEGNVGTVIDLGHQQRKVYVNPPPSPSMTFGLPLQLSDPQPLVLPRKPTPSTSSITKPGSPLGPRINEK